MSIYFDSNTPKTVVEVSIGLGPPIQVAAVADTGAGQSTASVSLFANATSPAWPNPLGITATEVGNSIKVTGLTMTFDVFPADAGWPPTGEEHPAVCNEPVAIVQHNLLGLDQIAATGCGIGVDPRGKKGWIQELPEPDPGTTPPPQTPGKKGGTTPRVPR